ncbi:sugar ABC transporter permease [Kitasatospora sp. NBC_01246]|uniref:carbohydrate ABC transporter permease n=1 Tax=Kitasatospora sp. NBC_01246 TaxID=2903570 RepID=UPI002E3009C9|nr:sugar ABC transporter permease [Kitasatospora sp. NBC_01246]
MSAPTTTAPAASTSPSGRRRGTGPAAPPRGRRRPPLLLLLPAAIIMIPLVAYPIYQLGLLSVLDFGQAQASGGVPTSFVGLGNYEKILSDTQFWSVLTQTIGFAAFCVIATLAVGATLAVLLTRVGRVARLVLTTAAMAAWAAPAMTGSTVWSFLFDTNLGLVNKTLVDLGLSGFHEYNWFYDKWSAFLIVGAVVVWHSFPFVMVTLYAGIRAIPEEILEAAALDGASTWTTFRRITAPMLRPILTVVVIQSVIWDFKVFTQIYVMTEGGGIAGQNLVLNVYAYQKAFASSQYGLGAAIGVIMLLILVIPTVLYIRTLRRTGNEL